MYQLLFSYDHWDDPFVKNLFFNGVNEKMNLIIINWEVHN